VTRRGPTTSRERAAWADRRLLVGVDEVGRGPLAGPVVAAAVAFPPGAPRIRGLRDSKVLTARRRAALAEVVRRRAALLGLGAASPRLIDRVNIRVATAIAMRRALARALGLPLPPEAALPAFRIVVDGLPFPELGVAHEALVDGDALCYSVAAAGVLAKTVRDRLMARLAARHPGYGWETNAGYATADHLAGLDRLGPTAHHRRSFTPVAQLRLV
jgi:ribonuclease HII